MTGEKEGRDPVSCREVKLGGERFSIARHFVGERDLSALMEELAQAQAIREMGL